MHRTDDQCVGCRWEHLLQQKVSSASGARVPPAIGIRNCHPNSVGDCAAIKLPVLKDILSDTYRFSKHFVELSLRV